MQPPAYTPPPSEDRPSFGYAALGFFIPLVGIIMYFVMKGDKPLSARSAIRGVGLSVLLSVACLPVWAAVMFPVFARARENARRASCQSNLKMLALAAYNYEQKNGALPDIGSPQVIQSLLPPSAPGSTGVSVRYACPSDSAVYKGNPALSNINTQQVSDPAATILFYESDNIHLEGCNVAFADGHVKWYPSREWATMKQQAGLR